MTEGEKAMLAAFAMEVREIKHAMWKLIDVSAQASMAVQELANHLIQAEED